MPKRKSFKDYPYYIVTYFRDGEIHSQDCVSANIAVKVYRQLRSIYGDTCRIAKVVVNYGEEI